MKPRLSPTEGESEDGIRTHHSLPQDQALRGVSVDLQLNGLRRVIGTKTNKKKNINKLNQYLKNPHGMLVWSITLSVNVRKSDSYLLGKTDFGRAMYPFLSK